MRVDKQLWKELVKVSGCAGPAGTNSFDFNLMHIQTDYEWVGMSGKRVKITTHRWEPYNH